MAKVARKINGFPDGVLKTTGSFADLGALKIYYFTTAITTAVTAVPTGAAIGDLAVTTHATGQASLFKNIGGVWTAV